MPFWEGAKLPPQPSAIEQPMTDPHVHCAIEALEGDIPSTINILEQRDHTIL